MIPKAAVLCMTPMIIGLPDQQGRMHTFEVASGYYRHPWTGVAVWFSCCLDLGVLAEGRGHLTRAVLDIRREVDARWGLAVPVHAPSTVHIAPFELDRHGAQRLLCTGDRAHPATRGDTSQRCGNPRFNLAKRRGRRR